MHSTLVFAPPFLTNFDFPKKTPSLTTIVQIPVSKRGEIRTSLQPYPIWSWDFPINWLRGGEQDQNSDYQYLLGWFLSMGGMFSDFLLKDQYDNTVTNNFFGVGDGATTQFQLVRSIGIGSDIVQNLNGDYSIQANEEDVTNFTIGSTGIVSFATPPAAGVLLTWSGSYYYRVRFDSDSQEFDQFMDKLWSSQSMKLKSVILI